MMMKKKLPLKAGFANAEDLWSVHKVGMLFHVEATLIPTVSRFLAKNGASNF